MTVPTHVVFYVFMSNLVGIKLDWGALLGILGTIVPDISNPNGGIGRLIRPVAALINTIWGHRSITHSWVMVLLSIIFCIIVKAITEDNTVWLFLAGVASHIMLDMMNINGVRFFYPDRILVVMPAEKKLRIATGSKREHRITFAFLVLTIITLPIGIWGYESSIRFLAGSHSAAVEEYKSAIDTNEVFVEVLSGINRITQEPITNKIYKVVAAMPKKLTLVETENGKRVTIGQVEEAIIETKQMRVKKGVNIRTEIIEIDAAKEGWKTILKELESPFSYAIGTLMVDADITDYRHEMDKWDGIDISRNIITLNYSGTEAINKLINYKIVEGRVKIRKELSEEGIMSVIRESKEAVKSNIFLVNTSHEGLRVREGQVIKGGDVIAVDPEVDKVRAEIEVQRKSLETKDIEEEKANALQDKSIEIKREMDSIDKNIEVQRNIVKDAGNNFKEAEKARLDRMEKDKENLTKEYNEIKRSIEENKQYIIKRKNALKEETESKIKSYNAQINSMAKRSPHAGKITSIKQKSANVYEIEVEAEDK